MVPFRYGLTLILTRYLVRYLRLKGKAPQVQENDRLRNLAKEGAEISRERLKARMARSRRNVLMKRNQR
uniref:30S ribosomal protein S21 n=2 Tax=Schistosoma TaxID=6181 RepID=A0A5K4F9G8_SCHMA